MFLHTGVNIHVYISTHITYERKYNTSVHFFLSTLLSDPLILMSIDKKQSLFNGENIKTFKLIFDKTF